MHCHTSPLHPQSSHHREHPSFTNQIAATSLLRQAHSFHIYIQVFSVLLQRDLALYMLDNQQENLKIWDLRQLADACDIRIILANVRRYTSRPYALRVHKALNSVEGLIKPWKWDVS